MTKTVVIANLVAKEDTIGVVQSELEKLVASTADEAGTVQYVLSQDAADATSFWVFEVYADGDALNVHMGSETMASMLVSLDGKLAAPPALHVLTPVKAKGLDI